VNHTWILWIPGMHVGVSELGKRAYLRSRACMHASHNTNGMIND
jgi:hypothetical protein